jgi:DMSO/TMAO reductase YedYZ molybdopterin-dependent catalytic subunit
MPDDSPVVRRVTRRAALAATGGAAAALAADGMAAASHEPPRPTPDRPPPSADLVSYEETVLAFRNHGFHAEFLDQPITPLGSHYLLIHFDVPQLGAAGYQISIGGRVARPTTLTLDAIRQRPVVRQPTILECAGTGRTFGHPRAIYVPWFSEAVGCYEFTGTPLRGILEEVGLLDDATEIVFSGWDQGFDLGTQHFFERALPVEEALRPEVLLAWDANGQPLLPAHGFPLRLVVPTWYGMASVKWLRSITVIDHTFQGVEQKQVYRLQSSSSDGGRPVRHKAVRSALKGPGMPDAISRMRFVPRGRHVLKGMAWSGRGAITRVEVSTDDRRSWRPATLAPQVGAFAWTPFSFTWDVQRRGEYILSSRATDAKGNVQPLEAPWNLQGMAVNHVERIPVRVR